jgi:hypothetical protein
MLFTPVAEFILPAFVVDTRARTRELVLSNRHD